jgi:hypothetical protein
MILRNYKVHAARKKVRQAASSASMQDVALEEGDGPAKLRKRDMILGAAGAVLKNVTGAAAPMLKNVNERVKNYTQKLRSAVAASPGDLPSDRQEKYAGWIMERIQTTKQSVGFFLAKMKNGEEKPFAVALKQDRIEVIEIAPRRDLKTTFLVEPGPSSSFLRTSAVCCSALSPLSPNAPLHLLALTRSSLW